MQQLMTKMKRHLMQITKKAMNGHMVKKFGGVKQEMEGVNQGIIGPLTCSSHICKIGAETSWTAGDITKKVRIGVPEEYFDWYDMTDERQVRFAKMKLVKLAKAWRNNVETDLKRLGRPPIVHV